ncbi:hypothetical protein D9611_008632 [Ephemerocybe angulata]|uniref:XPG-I domain-containing protein n=1 Tax=Ephemerocybe angulata TaxID=980116 RepID=A0A8H5AYS5_9AGAR|nr:hypothetical protein D9611_008632 [Tulosesus angulatus]
MGINDLWPVLQPGSTKIFLTPAAIKNMTLKSSDSQPHIKKLIKVGIDMGTFMDECIAGAHSAGIHHQFAGGPLRPLFFRLAQLLKIPASFIFIFDGPNRPPKKRGITVQSQSEVWWVDDAQRMIEAFGFHVHEAPGEAEAELALLNRWEMIDALWTSDGDSMVFGGQAILRSIPSREKDTGRLDEFRLYTAESVLDKVSLDHGQLVLYALVAGGDYGGGLRGGGTASACEIARSSIGRSFSDHLKQEHGGGTLDEWRKQTLTALNSENARTLGISTRTRNLLAKHINSFPTPGALDAYMHPATSLTHPAWLPSTDNWSLVQQPNVPQIVDLCRQRNVWEGIIFRLMLSDRCIWDRSQSSFGPSSSRLHVDSCRTLQTKALNPAKEEVCVRLGVLEEDLFLEMLAEAQREFLELPKLPEAKPVVVRVWAPVCMVPEWILEDKSERKRGKKRAHSGQGQNSHVKRQSKGKGKEREWDSPPLLLTDIVFPSSSLRAPNPSTVAGTSSDAGPSCASTPLSAASRASSSFAGTSSMGLLETSTIVSTSLSAGAGGILSTVDAMLLSSGMMGEGGGHSTLGGGSMAGNGASGVSLTADGAGGSSLTADGAGGTSLTADGVLSVSSPEAMSNDKTEVIDLTIPIPAGVSEVIDLTTELDE